MTTTALIPSATFVEQVKLLQEQVKLLTEQQAKEIFSAWKWLAEKQGNFGQDVEIKEVMEVAEIGDVKPHPLVYDMILSNELDGNQATTYPEQAIESDYWYNHPQDADSNYWKSEQMEIDSAFIEKELKSLKTVLLAAA